MKNKKLISGLVFCASFMTLGLVGCGNEPAIDLCAPNGDYSLCPGEIVQLETKLTEIKQENVTYTVSGAATITKDGKLTVDQDAVVGSEIIVTAKSGNVEKKITIVVEKLIPSNITLTSSNTKIAKGGKVTFNVEYTPNYATSKAYTLTVEQGSEYAEIVNGELVLKSSVNEETDAGQTIKVKATLDEDNSSVSSTVDVVIVKSQEIYTIVATNVNYNTSKDSNKYLSIDAYNEAGDKITTTLSDYTYESSNENIAFVDANGKIFPKGHGEATISVESSNGKTAQCKVFVMVPTTEFGIKAGTVSNLIATNKVMSFSKLEALTLEFNMKNSSYTSCTNAIDYTFELLNDDDEVIESGNTVATVNSGAITFAKTGRVKVTVKTNSSLNNVKTASYEKTVELIVNVNEGINVHTVANLVSYANQSTNKVANILCDLYLDATHNFGADSSNYYALAFYGDRTIYGNGYVISNERLPLIVAGGDTNQGCNMLEFNPVNTTTPFAVNIQDLEVVGCGGVNAVYTGELAEDAGKYVVNTSNGKFIRTYRRGIVVSGNLYDEGRSYVKELNITNVKISGFDVALRIEHAVNAYVSDCNISNCFSNGIESNQNIITMNNMTIGQVGAFAIEQTPDDMKDKETADPKGTAGANYDQTSKVTMTGYIHCSNFNNGASTLYMQGMTSSLGGTSVPDLIQAITMGTIAAITQDPAAQSALMGVAQQCLFNASSEINFYMLIFINPSDFPLYTTYGNQNNKFAEYASDSSVGNMINLTEVLIHIAQDPTWIGYRNYNYICFDLQTGPTNLGNIGQVILINQAYQA